MHMLPLFDLTLSAVCCRPLFWCGLQEKVPGQKREGKTHNDMWVLNMKAAVSGGDPTWDRVSTAHPSSGVEHISEADERAVVLDIG